MCHRALWKRRNKKAFSDHNCVVQPEVSGCGQTVLGGQSEYICSLACDGDGDGDVCSDKLALPC